MAWIESHQALGRHPKLLRLAVDLEIDKAQAIGHLHYLWWWALEYKRSGNLAEMTSQEIANAAEWSKDSVKFLSALKKNGWLEENGKLHDWKHYSGKWISSLARQKRYRKVTSPLRNALHNRYVEKTSNLTKHNLTKPDHITTPTPSFQKPTGEEATAYAASIGLVLDGHYFVDYYETRGWMIKGAKIKNWKACVRTWKTNTKNGIDNKASLIALTETVKAMP